MFLITIEPNDVDRKLDFFHSAICTINLHLIHSTIINRTT